MKLLKPDWIHYDEKPIFSVDVHPGGNKFATGGQGQDSGRVVIWNLVPVLSMSAELDKTVPKILCQLDNHLACVNCVRWSMNGVLLASGGDDKIIMIWKKGKGPSAVFGNAGITKTTESWRCISTLRGHSGDILDLAWSPQDRWLASCSVDNNVIIWDMLNLPTMVAILKGHTGLVKGVTWDPVGKFIASQSDDRSVKIWKTSDWTCQSTITDPFEECGGTTHVLRLSWSPDGLYLVSAHAMNGGGPTAQIIEREGWKCDKDFVGHRKAVTCVRFHNSILKRQAPKTNKSQQYCCLAVGSRDRSLSVWMTALQRPLVVIHDLFQDTILDLSWSTDRNILLACSTDGTVACLQFTSAELGTPLSEDDKNSLYQRMYGKSADIDMNAQSGKDMIIEYAELVNINEKSTSNHMTELSLQNNNLEMVNTKSVAEEVQQTPQKTAAIHKQIETRTVDGKRRITPMFIPLNQDEATDATPQLNSSSRSTTNIIIEKTTETHLPSKNVATVAISVAKEKDLPTTIITNASVEKTHLDSRLTIQSPAKAKLDEISQVHGEQTATTTASITTTLTTTIPSTTTASSIHTIASPTPAKFNLLTAGKAVPHQGSFARSIGEYRIQVTNSFISTTFGQLSKLACSSIGPRNQQLWDIVIGSPVTMFCLCLNYVLACSLDGTLRFLNIRTGELVMPVIKIPTTAVQCAFNQNSELGGVISECGKVCVWIIAEHRIYISTSCTDILTGANVAQFFITDDGIVFVVLSNGCSYSYSKQLESWMVLNSKDPIVRYGMSKIPINQNKNLSTQPLSTVQSISHNFQPTARNFADIDTSDWQHAAKLFFIENQIKICEAINSPMELQYWYSMLGTHLASHGTERRIRILLDDLLGPAHFEHTEQRISRQILNINTHDLMAKILDHLKREPRWQRLYMEYLEQLEIGRNGYAVIDKDEMEFN